MAPFLVKAFMSSLRHKKASEADTVSVKFVSMYLSVFQGNPPDVSESALLTSDILLVSYYQ